MANFPTLAPSNRSYDPGDWANTKYRANSGAEFRILYGSKRTAPKLQLTYNNITDAQAKDFLDHYDSMNGTFKQFPASDTVTGTKKGMGPTLKGAIKADGSHWRYEGPPQLTSVYPGRSNVTVNLIGATNA